MTTSVRRCGTACAGFLGLLLGSASAVVALEAPERGGRFDALIVEDPQNALDVATTPLSALPVKDGARAGWELFRATHGPEWRVHLDRRSGAPLLAEGPGIPWSVPRGATVETIAASLRTFIAGNRALLLADNAELVLDTDASGSLTPEVWQVVFKRVVAGVPVAGERYLFTIGYGHLTSFGTPRWSRIDSSPLPDLDAGQAHERLSTYMRLTATDAVEVAVPPTLELIALRAAGPPTGAGHGPFVGGLGSGYASALVWRVALRVAGEPGTWLALVDAHSGAIRSFTDDNRYAKVKGGMYPISSDQICPDGCEQPNHPMPFADITIDGNAQTTSTMGMFDCTPGGYTATTTLSGPYFKVNDTCGAIVQSVACESDLDLAGSEGADCDVPEGASAGNTHAARTGFYHLNRIAEHARTWLPTRPWLTSLVTDNVNIGQTCNAYWNGASVNFYRSGGGCRNTGEIAGVFLHEWGHGMDQNDGGGYDNPSEAYADVTAFMATHVSCIGRGFRSQNCGGNGNACLNCTGVRDQDWDQRANHVPSTPAGFLATYCAGGAGACGKEVHCEGYVGGETLWDLAVRDLPAMGLDQATAWNLADKLWYKSRLGSGGNAYNCSLPFSDGCSAGSWFHKLRIIDDNDGNLANGTPHAAAIFAAFDRHKIACGSAGDASNQNSTTCPALGAPTLSTTAGSGTVALSWTTVPGALGYRILRNDSGCQAAMTRISGLVTTSSFTDLGLANGSSTYYNVQAFVSNSACDGPLSNCQAVTPQPFAGTVGLDSGVYGCSSPITITVVDSNIGGNTTTVDLVSTSEATPETITLTRVSPGSATYVGTINTTSGGAAPNGSLSVQDGDAITATYVDASDGGGGVDVAHSAGATGACALLGGVKPVADGRFGTAMTGSRADASGGTIDLTWDVATCTSPNHHVIYGDLAGVASATVGGAACNLGTSGSAAWSGVPAGDLWFVVVGDDGASTEGSWGTDGTGAQRNGTTPSGECSVTTRDNSGACP